MKHISETNSFNGRIKRCWNLLYYYPSRFKSTRSINTYGLSIVIYKHYFYYNYYYVLVIVYANTMMYEIARIIL